MGYDPWESIDFQGENDFVQELSKSYKAVRVASDVDSSSISKLLQIPGNLAVQCRTRAQAPKFELAKTSQDDAADTLVSKLPLSKERFGDN